MRFLFGITILAVLVAGMALVIPARANVNTNESVTLLPPQAAFSNTIDQTHTTQAVVTFSKSGSSSVHALFFPVVPDLDSCHSLAYAAVNKSQGESSAVCLDAGRKVVGTFFCQWQQGQPNCQVMPH